MKKIIVVILVICSFVIACGKKDGEQTLSDEDVAALLEIHDFSSQGVIQDENTPVRSAPDQTDDANVIGKLQRDIPVTITRRKGQQSVVDQTIIYWYEVTDGKIKGWVFGHSVGLQE
jgi:hypothetical protein